MLSLGPAEALPDGGWGLPVFTEDAIDPLLNPLGEDTSDLLEDSQQLLLQGTGEVRFRQGLPRRLAIDYGAPGDLVVADEDFKRVTEAWHKILGAGNGGDSVCGELKTTIKLQLPTQRLCAVHTQPGRASVVEPEW